MYCLSNFCYVCLEKKDKLLSNIKSSLSADNDIIHIIGYLPINLAWLKTMRIILICEECCLRLRETYQFLEKCLKNSAQLQKYMDNLNITPTSNTENVAELVVKFNITQEAINEVKCEIQSDDEEIYTYQGQPNIEETEDEFVGFEECLIKEGIICKKEVDDKQEYPTDNNSSETIEETEDVCVNIEDSFIQEQNTWKREEVNDTEEYPMDNNSTEIVDNDSDSEISASDNAHVTNTDGVTSGFTCKQATNKNDLNTAAKKSYKCSTCSKSFFTKTVLNIHTCGNILVRNRAIVKRKLVRHMRTHSGEKPYECSKCKQCFTQH